jgi:hypothetical protein
VNIDEAHAYLHERLPAGSTVTISQNLWTRSTVGDLVAPAKTSGDWHVVVTVPDHIDHVEGAFGSDLRTVVEQVLAQLANVPAMQKPPRIAAPSKHPSVHEERKRDAS